MVRFDGQSGDFIDSFVASVSNGLSSVTSLEFGPDNKLYVLDFFANQVLRYDSHTGAFIDDFIPAGSGGLNGAVALTFVPNIAPVPTLSRQIGTPFDDTSNTIFVTADAVWIGGQTAGTLAGETSSGGLYGFVQKYTLGGTLLCTDQFGTSGDETVTGIKVDETTPDSVYVTGDTTGVLGTSSLGDSDIYVRKYDSDCNSQWTTQFGTDGTDTAGTNIGLTPDGRAFSPAASPTVRYPAKSISAAPICSCKNSILTVAWTATPSLARSVSNQEGLFLTARG